MTLLRRVGAPVPRLSLGLALGLGLALALTLTLALARARALSLALALALARTLTLTRWEHSGGCGVAALQDQWEASCDPAKKFTYTNPNPGYTAKVVMLEMIDP